MSLLLNVESVTNDGGGDDIMKMFLGALTNEDGLPSHHIRNQFMPFDAKWCIHFARVEE